MKAVVISRFGPPEVLEVADRPDPVAGPGQVVIDVEVAGITFVETQVRAGCPPSPAMLPSLPAVLGNGVGGRVTTIGEGVDQSWLGKRVVSATGGSGGYAERAAVHAAGLIAVPEGLTLPAATALLADGRTALALTRLAEIEPGDVVAVEAAAGGVGSLLVQLARNAGAKVVGLAGSQRKLTLARQLGASVTVDYSRPDWVEVVRGTVPRVDVMFDGVGGAIGSAALDLVHPGGRFCSFGMASGQFAQLPPDDVAARGVKLIRGVAVSPDELTALSSAALQEAAAGRLQPLIGQTFPLTEAARAHRAIESRMTAGKTLLSVVRPS